MAVGWGAAQTQTLLPTPVVGGLGEMRAPSPVYAAHL